MSEALSGLPPLLGLPLKLALAELARQGIGQVRVERSVTPRREGVGGEWRVVRVREGAPPVLDVCCFEWTV